MSLSVAVKNFVKHKARICVAKFTLKESCSGHQDSEQLPGLDVGIVLGSALKYLGSCVFPQRRYIFEFR